MAGQQPAAGTRARACAPSSEQGFGALARGEPRSWFLLLLGVLLRFENSTVLEEPVVALEQTALGAPTARPQGTKESPILCSRPALS